MRLTRIELTDMLVRIPPFIGGPFGGSDSIWS